MAKIAIIVLLGPLLVLLLLGGFVMTVSTQDDGCAPLGEALQVDVDSVPPGPIAGYRHEQLVNAAHIMLAGQKLGLSARDQQIGVMTAMGESGLRVIDYGDAVGPDSRGLFQQRDNGAWGSYEDRMNPFVSATNFFRVLSGITERGNMTPTRVANAVQRNANPDHYAKWWGRAGQVVNALGNVQEAATERSNDRYRLGVVDRQAVLVANTVGPQFGIVTVRTVGDTGLVVRFMVDDIPDGSAVGQRLAEYVSQNADPLKVKHVAWKNAVWSPERADEGWRPLPPPVQGEPDPSGYVQVALSASAPRGSAADGRQVRPDCLPGGVRGEVTQSGWAAPAQGPLTSGYGPRTSPGGVGSTWHRGVDLAPGCDQPIWAAQSGTVDRAGASRGYGNLIVLDHGDGVTTRYAHMYDDGVLVTKGQEVVAGQQIGKIGSSGHSTGCHLHFEILIHGTQVNPQPILADMGITFQKRGGRQ